MGEETAITWCHHTFNPWRGCYKISPACTHCYAETFDDRFAGVTGGSHWGLKAPRLMFGDDHWKQPIRWNRKAAAAGERRRVFCASMADVFEDRPDLEAPRDRLWDLIRDTPWLDWLLLTKRPENFDGMLPWWGPHTNTKHPDNVWLGVTAESQEWANQRIPELIKTPCAKRFVSYEPALGAIDFAPFFKHGRRDKSSIDWLIYGDESGHDRRPADLEWARSARDAAKEFGVAFHCKQLHPTDTQTSSGEVSGEKDKRGKIHLPVLDGRQHGAFPT